MTVEEITRRIRSFRDERDWAQFHNPKDMSVAISVEAAELLQHFLWKSKEESEARAREHIAEVKEEIADIAIFLFELADNLGLDVLEIMAEKLEKNAAKYPVSKAKGKHLKYTELE
jgi:NTP pyrophosphatase (non-canonical NTP hydrolase)